MLHVVMIITVRLLFTHYTASIANNVDAVLLLFFIVSMQKLDWWRLQRNDRPVGGLVMPRSVA